MELMNLEKYKAEIHRTLIAKLDLEKLSRVNSSQARQAVSSIVKEIIADQRVPLNYDEQERIQADLLDEVFGLGPLEPLLRDPKISDILVNDKDHVFIEKGGLLQRVNTSFRDDRHLLQIIDRIVSRVGRRVDESSPMVDARLPDGSRVNAIIPPLALDGPSLSIRRFGTGPLAANQLVSLKSISAEMMEVLSAAVKAKISIVVSGGTGAGKTTFMNILSQYIPHSERLVTIEDAAELRLAQENIVRLETRPPNIEGQGAIRQRQLLSNALRMRPDRIIIGEVRGEEAFDMLQAMNTGHEGSMTTVHANTPRDAISRLESMVAMGNLNLNEKSVRQQIASAVQIVVWRADFVVRRGYCGPYFSSSASRWPMTYFVSPLRFLRVSSNSAFVFSISSRCLLMSKSEIRRMRTCSSFSTSASTMSRTSWLLNGLKPS